MKRNEWKNKAKKLLAVAMLACMLFTWGGVNSDAGIMPCGEFAEYVIEEL